MTVGDSSCTVWLNQCDVPVERALDKSSLDSMQMKSNDDDNVKAELAVVEQRLYAFKDRMENMVARQAELEKRLRDAEMRAEEAVELRRKYDRLLAENCELKQKLLQYNNNSGEEEVLLS